MDKTTTPTAAAMRAAASVTEFEGASWDLISKALLIDDATGLPELLEACRGAYITPHLGPAVDGVELLRRLAVMARGQGDHPSARAANKMANAIEAALAKAEKGGDA